MSKRARLRKQLLVEKSGEATFKLRQRLKRILRQYEGGQYGLLELTKKYDIPPFAILRWGSLSVALSGRTREWRSRWQAGRMEGPRNGRGCGGVGWGGGREREGGREEGGGSIYEWRVKRQEGRWEGGSTGNNSEAGPVL